MTLKIRRGSSRPPLLDIANIGHQMTLVEILFLFQAFGYKIDKHYLRLEMRHNLDDFAKDPNPYQSERDQMIVGKALEIIDDPHSWLQKYGNDAKRYSVLWFAKELGLRPVGLMQTLQGIPSLVAYRDRNGVYIVQDNPDEAKRVFQEEVPSQPEDESPAEEPVEVEEPESAVPTEEVPPPDDYNPFADEDPDASTGLDDWFTPEDDETPAFDQRKAHQLLGWAVERLNVIQQGILAHKDPKREEMAEIGLAWTIQIAARFAPSHELDLEEVLLPYSGKLNELEK